MNVALVYDRVNKWGGAERVLLSLHQIFPSAPLFTAVYDKKRAAWANVFQVHPSFLQHLPFAKNAHESLALLTPMAFESFNFDGFDVVISVTSAEAKAIITRPGTVHICYCLTPTRYLWSGFHEYLRQPGFGVMNPFARFGLLIFGSLLRRWDLVASQRPDFYIAISRRVKDRIMKYYHRRVAAVIYPPVEVPKFLSKPVSRKPYFLTVSRLVGYKRIDVIIRAFNELQLPLIVIGNGHNKGELTNIAGKTVQFVSRHLTDEELTTYYRECRAFIYAADEDFGLSAAEAQAYGAPVIAYKRSGVAEFVQDGISGVLFDAQNSGSLIGAVRKFIRMRFDDDVCRRAVYGLRSDAFFDTMKQTVETLVKEHSL